MKGVVVAVAVEIRRGSSLSILKCLERWLAGLDGQSATSYEEDAKIRDAMRSASIDGMLPTDKFAEAFRFYMQNGNGTTGSVKSDLTSSEREDLLRKRIHEKCKRYDDIYCGKEWGRTNARMIKALGKSRTLMTEQELIRAEQWIDNQFRMVASVA